MKKKSNKYIIGTILMLIGTIFLILSMTDSIIYQFDTFIIIDGVLITYHKIINIMIASLSLLGIIVGGFLRDH